MDSIGFRWLHQAGYGRPRSEKAAQTRSPAPRGVLAAADGVSIGEGVAEATAGVLAVLPELAAWELDAQPVSAVSASRIAGTAARRVTGPTAAPTRGTGDARARW